jgi:hypothetical protein
LANKFRFQYQVALKSNQYYWQKDFYLTASKQLLSAMMNFLVAN